MRGSGWFSQQPDDGLARRIRERPVNGEGSIEPVFFTSVFFALAAWLPVGLLLRWLFT